MKNTFLLLILIGVVLGACKKSSPEDPKPALTNTELLLARPWKLADVLVAGLGSVKDYEDVQAALGIFANSDLRFKADGTYTATSRTDGTVENGTWEWAENETKLIINKGESFERTFGKLLLNETNFNVSFPLVLPAPYTIFTSGEAQLVPA